MKKKIAMTSMFLLAVSLLLSVSHGYAYDETYHYRFDDISGASGRGPQWVVMTDAANSVGAPIEGAYSEDIRISGDIVNSRNPVYIRNAALNGIAEAEAPVSFIFAAFAGNTVSPAVSFAWSSADTEGGIFYDQDVTIGEDAYSAAKTRLPGVSAAEKRFRFDLTKTRGSSLFGTERTYMRFHQNPDYDPSQTLQIPLVLANVAGGSAQQSPLLFRTSLRDLSGSITAYSHFEWAVDSDIEAGGEGDWIFVPLASEEINSNRVSYRLVSSVRNFSGIRYGLDRYDMLGVRETLRPYKWTMDLPVNVKDVSPDIRLQELSHMAPGLITAYEQPFDVVGARQNVYSAYAVDPIGGAPRNPFDLTLVYPPIFGLTRGESSGDGYRVTGFQLLPSDIDFLKKAASALGGRKAVMPSLDIVDASTVTGAFVTADAIATVRVNRVMPEDMMRSNDVRGILPLHITLSLPSGNRFISPKWDELLAEFKKSGDARGLFAKNFSLYSYSDNRITDVFAWLSNNGALEKTVKIFVDEERGCVTLSFIALLLDGGPAMRTLHDSSAVSSFSYDYLAIGDGDEDDSWDITFYVAPLSDSPGGTETPGSGSSSGGSGGGCDSGLAASALLLSVALALKKRGD